MQSPPKTRRDRRVAARKSQILEAAAHVFSQKGYERATIREIAAAADLSEGSLYNYFKDKLELLIGVAEAYADGVTRQIDSLKAANFEEVMAQLLSDRFRSGRERRLFMLFLYEARLSPDVRRYYVQESLYRIIDATENRLRGLIEAGIMRPVDPSVAARAISATIMGFGALASMAEYENGDSGRTPIMPETLGTAVTDIFLHGLQAQRVDA